MQNKPNFRQSQMNVNLTLTKDYRKNDDFTVRINKPNPQNAKNERKLICYRGLWKWNHPQAQKKQTQNKPNQTQFPKSPNERKLNFNKGLQKKRCFLSPKKQTQFTKRPKMNINLYVIEDYKNETAFRPKKQTQFKPNFPPIQLISIAIDVNIGSYSAGFQQPNIANPIFWKSSMNSERSEIFIK